MNSMPSIASSDTLYLLLKVGPFRGHFIFSTCIYLIVLGYCYIYKISGLRQERGLIVTLCDVCSGMGVLRRGLDRISHSREWPIIDPPPPLN